MTELVDATLAELQRNSIPELGAVILAVAYLLLAGMAMPCKEFSSL